MRKSPTDGEPHSTGDDGVQRARIGDEAYGRTLLSAVGEAVALCEVVVDAGGRPTDYRFLEVNAAFAAVMGIEQDAAGRTARELVPSLEDHWVETCARAGLGRETVHVVNVAVGLGRWFDVYAAPVGPADGRQFAVSIRDVSERVRAETALRESAERAAFRSALADALRTLADPTEVKATATHLLGEHLQASRVHYGEIDDSDYVVIDLDYTDGAESLTGRFRMDSFNPALVRAHDAGRIIVTPDVAASVSLSRAYRDAYAALGVAAQVCVPLVKDGALVAVLAVHQSVPREWTAAEASLVEETAERTWAAIERARAAAHLVASEARYRTLFTTIDEGFALCELIVDESGAAVDHLFAEVNPAFFTVTGLPADAAGRTARDLVPDLEMTWIELYAGVVASGEPVRYTDRVEALDRWFEVYVSPAGPPESGRFVLIFTDVSKRKRAEAAVAALNVTLESRVKERTRVVRQLAARLTVAEQAERERIALVLHDDLQQQHYGLAMILTVARDTPDEAPMFVDQALQILDQVVRTTRSLVTEMNPTVLQTDRLADLLGWVAADKTTGLDVAVEVRGDVRVPDPALRIVLFQAVREVLFNVAKHAGVASARIVAWEGGGEVVVRVEDDGAGFEPAAAGDSTSGGLGLFSVRERTEHVGGRFEIDSAPGRGTRVTLVIPSAGPAPDSP